MSPSKPLMVLAVLTLLGGLFVYGGSRSDDAPLPEQVISSSPRPVTGLAPVNGASGIAWRPSGRTGVSPAPAAAAPAPAPRVVRWREEFERSDDLYGFLQTLLPAVAAGDHEAAWLASRVYDYCAGFAVDPAGHARDTAVLDGFGLRSASTLAGSRDRIASRCRHFSPGDGLGRELVFLQRLEAAEAGSLAAEAALLAMGEPLDDSQAYRRDLVDRVEESRDPEAYSALSPAMGIFASGDPAHAGQVAGTPISELAWQLAACRLGLDCSAESALMTAYCGNGGVCPADGPQDFETFVYDAAIPRQGKDAVEELVDSLLSEGARR